MLLLVLLLVWRWRTLYLALLTMRLPSRSQLTEGLGLPKAVQVKVMLPPSLASTYWGGVSVNVGGAEETEDREKFGEKKNNMSIMFQKDQAQAEQGALFWPNVNLVSCKNSFTVYIFGNKVCTVTAVNLPNNHYTVTIQYTLNIFFSENTIEILGWLRFVQRKSKHSSLFRKTEPHSGGSAVLSNQILWLELGKY